MAKMGGAAGVVEDVGAVAWDIEQIKTIPGIIVPVRPMTFSQAMDRLTAALRPEDADSLAAFDAYHLRWSCKTAFCNWLNFQRKGIPAPMFALQSSQEGCMAEGLMSVSPFLEMGAYETIWQTPGATAKTVFDRSRSHHQGLPFGVLSHDAVESSANRVLEIMKSERVCNWGVRVFGTFDYPPSLTDAKYPADVLYYQGDWNLVYTPCVAVVGTRTPTEEGVTRAKKLTQLLVRDGYTIVSGLARGIDTVAHSTAIELGGPTIGVIGTPITDCHPKENQGLQELIAKDHLLISQVPVLRYRSQGPAVNRFFFPERNITMSALSEATVIIEAGETSGTLVQAKAALRQGRKLFILDNCFGRGLAWPEKLVKHGAIRAKEYSDIIGVLGVRSA
jgi:DNA processing protein